MKPILISICVLFLSYGCSKFSAEPTLDTTTKESSGTFTIKRWDGNNWIDTADGLGVSWTWKFISHLEKDDGSVRIKGGYTHDLSNTSDNDVEYGFSKFTFMDKDDIPIYEYTLPSRIELNVGANSTLTYSGTFEIQLDNIDIANQITEMGIWGRGIFP